LQIIAKRVAFYSNFVAGRRLFAPLFGRSKSG